MSADAYLIIILAGLTVLLITMQPVVWVAWGVLCLVYCVLLMVELIRLMN